MTEIDEIRNRVLYNLIKNESCLNKALGNTSFLELFNDDEYGQLIARESLDWFKRYKKTPEFNKHILENYIKSDPDKASALKMRLFELKDFQVDQNVFEADVDLLKLNLAKDSFKIIINNLGKSNIGDIQKVDDLSKVFSGLNKNISKINNKLSTQDGLPHSDTTKASSTNIEALKSNDISGEKRFKIGHKVMDNESFGFKYGEVFMVLGNIGSGKSMFLTNIAYNQWKNGANILMLTAEMQPSEFDSRIYSRAAGVDYTHIINGKGHLNTADLAALDECVKFMKDKTNEIKIRYVTPSDNIGTITAYMEELKMNEGFIPDILIVDSFEHISPLDTTKKDQDWMAVGQIMIEFKTLANTFENNRGLFVVSTHQAKTITLDKKFEDITIGDFGRSKIIPEKADACVYIRSLLDLNTMNVKNIKARRFKTYFDWTMGIDFSKCMIHEIESDQTNSSSIIDYSSVDA